MSDICVGIEVLKDSGITDMIQLIGPTSSQDAHQ